MCSESLNESTLSEIENYDRRHEPKSHPAHRFAQLTVSRETSLKARPERGIAIRQDVRHLVESGD